MALTTDSEPPATKRKAFRPGGNAPYFFISPFYLLFAIFFLLPTLFALGLGFFSWSALGVPHFFGLRNYERMFTGDPIFWQAVGNTAFYAASSLFVVAPLALLLALALNAKELRFRTFWRAVYFAPIVTSTVAISIVFRLLYNEQYGLISAFIGVFGFEPVNWLGNVATTKFAVMGVVL